MNYKKYANKERVKFKLYLRKYILFNNRTLFHLKTLIIFFSFFTKNIDIISKKLYYASIQVYKKMGGFKMVEFMNDDFLLKNDGPLRYHLG